MRKLISTLTIVAIFIVSCKTPEREKQPTKNEGNVQIEEMDETEIVVKPQEKKEVKVVEKEATSVQESTKKSYDRKNNKSKVAASKGIMGALSGQSYGVGGGGNALGIGGLSTRGRGGVAVGHGYGRAAVDNLQVNYAYNSEQYESPDENSWKSSKSDPLSTFSIDVDTASYSNFRRFITEHQLPPEDAVRIEEMINYFTYNYKEPANGDPVRISTELTKCPWSKTNSILKVGIKGKSIDLKEAPAGNLVFLIDVSGSMMSYNKLPLLKKSFKLLVNNLRENDSVSIAVYAGAAGTVLEPTKGSNKEKILKAIDQLRAGGSTAGAQGIQLAYKLAEKSLIKGGNNRVILATDGDFNVGVSSDSELVKLIEKERKKGIFLTVLGFGMGNYKDSKMEKLADKGNGNYAYIDNLLEAKKVLVNQMSGTLFTIAKDVKIQVEFNPAAVAGYRLIGYENRMLKKEDFNNDKKDAGEVGAGHTVTALYEIIPAGSENSPIVDDLKYQKNPDFSEVSAEEMATVKVRYKKPDADKSRLIKKIVKSDSLKNFESANSDTRFAVTVAAAGMMLKKSETVSDMKWNQIIKQAKASKGSDKSGYRAEFINLIEKAELISSSK
jgi:Ca-activated chloride channel family protein